MKNIFTLLFLWSTFILSIQLGYSQNNLPKDSEIISMPDGVDKLDAYLILLRSTQINHPDSALIFVPDALR